VELSEEESALIARAKARMLSNGGEVRRKGRVRSVRVEGSGVGAGRCSVRVPEVEVVGVSGGEGAGSWGGGASSEADPFWSGSLFEEWGSFGAWDLPQSHPMGW
jgi:hypothetical protein